MLEVASWDDPRCIYDPRVAERRAQLGVPIVPLDVCQSLDVDVMCLIDEDGICEVWQEGRGRVVEKGDEPRAANPMEGGMEALFLSSVGRVCPATYRRLVEEGMMSSGAAVMWDPSVAVRAWQGDWREMFQGEATSALDLGASSRDAFVSGVVAFASGVQGATGAAPYGWRFPNGRTAPVAEIPVGWFSSFKTSGGEGAEPSSVLDALTCTHEEWVAGVGVPLVLLDKLTSDTGSRFWRCALV